jgi:6,7-dimethyl-8-ribityllumazine synthase
MSDYKASLKDTSEIRKDIAIAFVVAEFNKVHTEALERLNREFLFENGFENVDTFWVPGAFEIP